MSTVAMMPAHDDAIDDFEDIVDGGEDSDSLDGEFTIEQKGNTEADNVFDKTVGLLQEMIAGEEFQTVLQSFMEQHSEVFEESEENKLCYTEIFGQYTACIEEFVERRLAEQVPGFKVESWLEELAKRQDEIDPELLDMLLSYSDFETFKGQMLAFKNRTKHADLSVTGKATAIHTDEQDDGEHRPDLDDLLMVSPSSPPGRSKKRICGNK